MTCRHCHSPLSRVFLDLGHAPPSNAYLDESGLRRAEITFPLRLFVCDTCRLVQTEDHAAADALFSPDYAYFSSTSTTWLDHAARFAGMMTERLGLGAHSHVIELASNDGYLLRNFVAVGIPCLGIEPTASTADAAERIGVPTLRRFFGRDLGAELAAQGRAADLVIGNNVYAHVPDINDFTAGIAAILKPEGVVTLEFPHLMRLVADCQFDTVYHEHFSYLSLQTVQRIFAAAGLRVFDVEELPTHGGSLRVHGCLASAQWEETLAIAALLTEEARQGLTDDAIYEGFQRRANSVKNGLLRFLLDCARDGKSVAAYGAAAKGNTILNFAGIKPDLLPFVCDAAPSKQGRFMPGSHIPILPPSALRENRPDYLVILPWNIADEVIAQMSGIAAQGTRFVTAVPELCIR
jgi:SAM-dependent methyltransferase